MSTFGSPEKDELYDNIVNFITKEDNSNTQKPINQIMAELMEVISYGIRHGIYKLENKTK